MVSAVVVLALVASACATPLSLGETSSLVAPGTVGQLTRDFAVISSLSDDSDSAKEPNGVSAESLQFISGTTVYLELAVGYLDDIKSVADISPRLQSIFNVINSVVRQLTGVFGANVIQAVLNIVTQLQEKLGALVDAKNTDKSLNQAAQAVATLSCQLSALIASIAQTAVKAAVSAAARLQQIVDAFVATAIFTLSTILNVVDYVAVQAQQQVKLSGQVVTKATKQNLDLIVSSLNAAVSSLIVVIEHVSTPLVASVQSTNSSPATDKLTSVINSAVTDVVNQTGTLSVALNAITGLLSAKAGVNGAVNEITAKLSTSSSVNFVASVTGTVSDLGARVAAKASSGSTQG